MSDPTRDRPSERDDVEALVRLAEPHSEIPSLRAARVRMATRAAWSRHVRGRQRRRRMIVGSSLAAAAATVALLLWSPWAGDARDGRGAVAARWLVEETVGVVTAQADGAAERPIAPGDALSGVTLRTGADGRALLCAASGQSLRVDHLGELQLRRDGVLALRAGGVYLDSGPDTDASVRDLHTPLGIVREVGTQYEARLLDGALRLRTREGAVVLVGDDVEHRVDVGDELHVAADGSVRRRGLTTYGSHWDWISEITVVPDFAGRPVADFLRWLARERGYVLTFDGADVQARTTETVLSGDLTRLTPDEALDVVSSTSGLAISETDGRLSVGGTTRR